MSFMESLNCSTFFRKQFEFKWPALLFSGGKGKRESWRNREVGGHYLIWSIHFGQFHGSPHPSLSSPLALSKLLKFSTNLFPHLKNGDKMLCDNRDNDKCIVTIKCDHVKCVVLRLLHVTSSLQAFIAYLL